MYPYVAAPEIASALIRQHQTELRERAAACRLAKELRRAAREARRTRRANQPASAAAGSAPVRARLGWLVR
jgi:hypothetical protein